MTGVLNTEIIVGKESTYGTKASTLTRGIEGKVDTWKREQEALQSTGFRGGMQAAQSARRTQINMGGAGTLEFDLLNQGFGLLMQGMLGSITGPTQQAATTAYKSTAATTADDPNDFFTVQKNMEDMSGTERCFTHLGCVMTGWTVSQAVGEMLQMQLDFDFRDVNTTETPSTPTYPAGAPFHWGQCVASIDGVNTDVMSMSLQGDLGLKTDRRYLKGDVLKDQPCRQTVPQFNGTIEMEFEDLVAYTDFTAGNIIPIIFTWTGPEIDSPYNYEFKITLQACQFDGDSPEASLSDTPKQTLPFMVLWDETNPAVQFEYTSVDTTL